MATVSQMLDQMRRNERAAAVATGITHAWLILLMAVAIGVTAAASLRAASILSADLARSSIEWSPR